MSLSNNQIRHLRKLAHALNPVVIVGQAGVTGNLLSEVGVAITHHELIKIKLNVGDRELRDSLIERILSAVSANLVQRIGNVAVLYRRNPEKKEPLAVPKN